MAFSFNANSNSNQSNGLGLHNQPINSQLNVLNFNVILGDRTNENVFDRSYPSRFISNINPTNQFTSQLGQSQRVTNELRNACLVPQRIQVVQTVSIDYLPLQNPSILSIGAVGGQVRVIEVVRTQLIDSTSTRERFLGANHGSGVWINQGETHFQSQANHSAFAETQPFSGVSRYQNRNHDVVHSYVSSNCPNVTQSSGHYFHNSTSEPYNPHVQTPNSTTGDNNDFSDPEPLDVYFPPGVNNPNPTQDDESQESGNNHDQGLNNICDDQEEYEIEGDGRTHSMPYKKYGPYTCPRCNKILVTSQLFAAHIGSHYRNETSEQRRKRQLVRYGKKHLRLVKSRDEISIVPCKPFKEFAAMGRGRSGVAVDVRGDGDSHGSSGQEIVVAPLKQEPMDL